MMGKHLRLAGLIMTIIGATMLVTMAVFVGAGYDFVLNKKIVFEEDQYRAPAEASGNIAIPGFEVWNIPAGQTKVESRFYNPEKNDCYFVLSVELEESGEVLYQSNYLKPGQYLYEVELKRAMSAGTYQAILHYDTYSIVDDSPLNGAAVPFSLVVKGS